MELRTRLLILTSLHVLANLDGSSSQTVANAEVGKDNLEYCTKHDCPQFDVRYNQAENVLNINEGKTKVADVYIHPTNAAETNAENCHSHHDDSVLCLSWQQDVSMDVRKRLLDKTTCFDFVYSSRDSPPSVCIPQDGAHWYGGSELHYQRWPIEKVKIPMQPYISQDLVVMKESFGNVLEPYWINSNGLGIFVDDATPLHVGLNENDTHKLCLKSQFQNPHFQNIQDSVTVLNFTLCKAKNVVEIHKVLRKELFDLPNGNPDERMVKRPIWSTWARYKALIDQKKVLTYAEEITSYGFPNSQIEIDDMFSSKYGEFDFDTEKFPDALGMIRTLNDKGFRTTVWITPFANLDSTAFLEGVEKGYWLKDVSGKVPALVKWWQGIGGILDVTKPEAVDWFVNRLKDMREQFGIDSFKFDAGEMTFLPSAYSTYRPLTNPGFFITNYVDAVSRLGNMIEVRCGYKSQRHPVFVRMGDKESVWGYDNGLKTIIPTVLTLGILGYPYVLPDMIGGNGYGENLAVDVLLPDRELYIRWLQVTTYLPAMQFSFVPWDYDKEVVEYSRGMVDIHEYVVTPLLMEAAKEAQESGSPLIRPLWWMDPYDAIAQVIDDQFMVGNKLLVAPVVDAGARSRAIYLPEGQWRDGLNEVDVTGGQWLYDYRVELMQVATFWLKS